ncbi:MAG: UbiD family decarboxylase [Firmicutes bacterium]|nr:UbiD family decarboxylase [Bacillota bacterium]
MLDLHQYLESLRRESPQEVLTVAEPVSLNQEVTAIVKALEAERKLPVLVFTHPVAADGRPLAYPLVMNLMASRRRSARLLDTDFSQVGQVYARRIRERRVEPIVIDRDAAPVKQVVKRGPDIDLFEFPAMVHFQMDPGPYISGGFLTTVDPDTGIDNTSLQRGWIVRKDAIRCYLTTYSHNRWNFNKYEAKGEDMPVAYWIGHHPLAYLGGQARLDYPESHYAAMGGLMGEPLRLVPSETFGRDLLVPADAEVVIEGWLRHGRRYPEGPFGEYTGYTGPQIPNPELEVTAVTHRRQPYWMNILVGGADNHWGSYAIEAVIYEAVKPRVPSLQAVYLPMSGQARFHVYLQLHDPNPGDAREAIMVTLTTDYRVKHVFVFDDDIDIFNEQECLFALATRTQWDRDVMIFPNTRGSALDPSVAGVLTTKGGIDCTKPPKTAWAERNRVDPRVLEQFDLRRWVSAGQEAAIPLERQ